METSLILKKNKSLETLPPYFEEICQAAIEGDYARLSALFKKACTVNIYHSYYKTPATKLAQEGYFKAPEMLLEFGAHLKDIGYGAAWGGCLEYAEQLRIQGASVHRIAGGAARGGYLDYAMQLHQEEKADINDIARGAAEGGYFEFAEQWGANNDWVSQGALLGGYFSDVERLRTEGVNLKSIAQYAARAGHFGYIRMLELEKTYLDYVACGAALGGYTDYAEKLRQQRANINWIAYGAARGGHFAYVRQLHKQGARLVEIAQGTAVGGHLDYAEKLKCFHNEFDEDEYYWDPIAYGAAQGGYFEYAEKLRSEGANLSSIVKGAALGGHIEYVEELWQKGAKISKIVEGFLNWDGLQNERQLLSTLSQIQDVQFKQTLSNEIGRKNPTPSIIATFKKADKIILLMHHVPLSYRQAQAWLTDPVLRYLILETRSLQTSLTIDIFSDIMHRITPQSLTQTELSDLLQKMPFYVLYKKPLLNELDQYLSQWMISYRSNAEKLKEDCKLLSTLDGLLGRLKAEVKNLSTLLTDDNEPYYQLLLKHCDKQQTPEQLSNIQNRLKFDIKRFVTKEVAEALLLDNANPNIKEMKQIAQQQWSAWNSPISFFFHKPNVKQLCQILSTMHPDSTSSLEIAVERLQETFQKAKLS